MENDSHEIVGADALQAMESAHINSAVAIAKRYPRDIAKFQQNALALATASQAVAATCFYRLERRGAGGKLSVIEGPSVRLAEMVASSWGHMRIGARIIADDGKFVTAQGVAWDMEANVQTSVEVRRRVTGRDGKRYSDDMVAMTMNAACSIAARNATNKVVPQSFTLQIMDAARKVALGDAKGLDHRKSDMVAAYGKIGVTPEMLCRRQDKSSVAMMTPDDVLSLLGTFTALRDGDTTVDEAFPAPAKDEPAATAPVTKAEASTTAPTSAHQATTTPPPVVPQTPVVQTLAPTPVTTPRQQLNAAMLKLRTHSPSSVDELADIYGANPKDAQVPEVLAKVLAVLAGPATP